MNKKLNTGFESARKIRLFMNYCSEKTLSENLLEQENIKTKSDLMYQEYEKEQRNLQKLEDEKRTNAWKEFCKYPNKAMLPGKNSAGVEGKDALIEGFCFYPAPSKNGISGIFIPQDSEINFWTVDFISYAVNQHLKKYPNEDKNMVIKNFSDIFPLGTVFSFKIGNSTYTTHITLNKSTGLWEFKYFYRVGDSKPYEPPTWVDERTSYQKFIDEYGFATQMTAALATALAGIFTGGAAWVLFTEIALEGTLGIAVGLREIEKGDNVSAALSFITGVLPMLKMSKFFTGIPEKEFIELSKELKTAGLTSSSDVSEYVKFYNGLSPNKQKIMSKLLKQDDFFKDQLLKSLDEELVELSKKGLKKMVEENPNLLQSIPFFERLWVRELGTNSVFILILTLINVKYGDILNSKDMERLKGVYAKIPESLKKEMSYNILANGDKIKEIIESKDFKTIEQFVDTKKLGESMAKWYNTKLKESINKSGGNYVELQDDKTTAAQKVNIEKKDEKTYRKEGWIPMSELKGNQTPLDYRIINDVDWVKIN